MDSQLLQEQFVPKSPLSFSMILFLAIFLSLGLASFVIFQPKQVSEIAKVDDTSSWKTYRNGEYGFEFKYPGDWHVFLNDTISSSDITLSNDPNFQTEEITDDFLQNVSNFSVQVRKNDNPKNKTIEEWFVDKFKYGFDTQIKSKVATNIDGKPTIRIDVTAIANFYTYFIPVGTDVISISYPSNQSKFGDIYEKILSTFKFVGVLDDDGVGTY